MKIIIGCLILILLTSCAPSQVELNATATQVAANDFATKTALAPTATPTTPPEPTATPLPITDNPQCLTVITLVDKEKRLFGETYLPIELYGFYYNWRVVAEGQTEIVEGAVEEVRIGGKTLTLTSNDLKDGMIHSSEFGDIKLMDNGDLFTQCIWLVATPEQVEQIFEWLK